MQKRAIAPGGSKAGIAKMMFRATFAASVMAASLLAAAAPALKKTFVHTIEAVVVLWWLTGFEVNRPELRSWSDYFRWLVAITLGAWAAGGFAVDVRRRARGGRWARLRRWRRSRLPGCSFSRTLAGCSSASESSVVSPC